MKDYELMTEEDWLALYGEDDVPVEEIEMLLEETAREEGFGSVEEFLDFMEVEPFVR